MRLNLGRSTFVFAGAWNVAIFVTEGWLAERVGSAPTNDPDLGLVNGRPLFRYPFEDVSVTVVDGQLAFAPEGNAPGSHARCEAIARAVLADLPATPVVAFGINVCFDVDEESDALRLALEPTDGAQLTGAGLQIEATKITRRCRVAEHAAVVNVSIGRSTALAAVQLDFNHHFELETKTAREALRILDGQAERALAISRRICADVYALVEG